MRVIVLGGTRFVGRAVVRASVAVGHDVLVVHRGEHEPADLPACEHLHLPRESWVEQRGAFARFGADAAVDVSAGNAQGAQRALATLSPGLRLVAVSSGDVYRAYEGLRSGRQTDTVPLTEDSPLRTNKHLDGPEWENLEIEERYLAADATVLRLGAVYGEHDYQYRFESVLRRVRAGRQRMPVGTGSFLFSRIYVGDVGRAVVAALGTPASAGECFNIVEAQTAPMRLFFEQIVAAAGADLELVQVAENMLPADLKMSGGVTQHLLMSPVKAQEILGWTETNGSENLRRSVQWHLNHPPADPDQDFSADERALASR